jgi:putative restriction endonuclease
MLVATHKLRSMKYWWVNQNQTFEHEVRGGFLWSPKTKSNGQRNHFYDTMLEARPGDIVFSFAKSHVQAIGVVKKTAVECPKPDFDGAGSNWNNIGWFLEVEFSELNQPFRPRDFKDQVLPLLPEKYSPLNTATGDGLQSVYLTQIPPALADFFITLSQRDIGQLIQEAANPLDDEDDEIIELEVQSRQLQGDLEKIQFVKARRGQGLFKANVRLYENECRVTHVTNIKHLRASHIKPWSKSKDEEKLDGANGLLLAPHVDHLFDRGFISFSGSGDLLVSGKLNTSVLKKWSISLPQNVGTFHKEQKKYLEYHQDEILQR